MRLTLLRAAGFLASALMGCQPPPAMDGSPLVVHTQLRPWEGGDSTGREILSDHYRIYTTSRSPEIISHLAGFMEGAYRNYLYITELPDTPGTERMPIYVMASRQEWAALTRSIVGPQWEALANLQAGGYCYKGVGVYWDIGGAALLAVASHEGLHQFLHYRLKDRLPTWLEEALASMAEGYSLDVHRQTVRFTPNRNPIRFGDLRTAIVQDWWIDLPRLLPMDGGDAMQLGSPGRTVGYYGQVWALGLMIRSDPTYAPRLAGMLNDAASGRLNTAMELTDRQLGPMARRGRLYNRLISLPAFRHYIDEDPTVFEQRYKAFARKLVRLS